jgi:hypothetical protein
MADWLAKAGLVLEKTTDLSPEGANDGKLTVTIWLARDRRAVNENETPRPRVQAGGV